MVLTCRSRRSRIRLMPVLVLFMGTCILVADGFMPSVVATLARVLPGKRESLGSRSSSMEPPRVVRGPVGRGATYDDDEEMLSLYDGVTQLGGDEEGEMGQFWDLLELGEDTEVQLGETPLLKVLSEHIKDPEGDPLFKNMQGKSWGDLLARAQTEYLDNRVEGLYHHDRLADKLQVLFDSLLEYLERHSVLEAMLYPGPDPAEPFKVDKDRADTYDSAYGELASARSTYLMAHVDFWSDLTSVLKAQEDIPSAGFRITGKDLTSDLPAPYGTSDSGIVLLPVPRLVTWKENEFGGVEEQIADLMALKIIILPQLDTMRTSRSSTAAGDALSTYTTTLSDRFWRKGPQWEERARDAADVVAAWNAMGKVVPTDPAATGIRVPGVGIVKKKGIEDAWVEQI